MLDKERSLADLTARFNLTNFWNKTSSLISCEVEFNNWDKIVLSLNQVQTEEVLIEKSKVTSWSQ